jgi:hypothetical protein
MYYEPVNAWAFRARVNPATHAASRPLTTASRLPVM